ncbi:hypothetical protein [Cellulomonas sp. URHD0024]|uniref:hypothetical protein n=1 Tax=Cellulomonas sp. URHD0024 TaxID=1302620 RepID=UPI00040774EB|nr:hypothetical protein [Cellulomonas sp. URHD0024]
MTHRSAARLVATAALLLALAGCAAPAAHTLPTDTVGADRAVPIPVSDGHAPVSPPARSAPPAAEQPSAAEIRACWTEVPAGATRAARAYAAALNAATSAGLAIDHKIHAAGDKVHLDDLSSQLAVDATLVVDVQAIEFPDNAAPAAADFLAAVRAYDEFLSATLQAGDFGEDYGDVDSHLIEQRGRRSSHLRDVLDLPRAGCNLRRP